jgi:hypothetical protein
MVPVQQHCVLPYAHKDEPTSCLENMDLDDMVDSFTKKIKPPTTMVAAAVGPGLPVGGEGASRACVSVPDP